MLRLAKAQRAAKPSPATVATMARAMREALVRDPSRDEWEMIVRYLWRGDLAAAERVLMGDPYLLAREWADRHISAFGQTYLDAAHAELARVGSRTRLELFEKAARKPKQNRFPGVPHSDEFIREQAGRLIVRVSDDQRRAVRDMLMERYNNEKRPETLVRDLRRSIGLDPRRARALRNFENDARERGVKNVDAQVERYRLQLIRDRAETIARTESVAIENQAKIEAWDIAMNAGDIPAESEQEWVTSADCCDDCAELDGERVSIGGSFKSTKYGSVFSPPLHPRCYCMLVLRSFKL